MGDFLLSLAPPGAARSQRRLLRRASGRVSGIRRRAVIGGARLASFHLGLSGVVRPFIAILSVLGTTARPIELRCTRHSSPFGMGSARALSALPLGDNPRLTFIFDPIRSTP